MSTSTLLDHEIAAGASWSLQVRAGRVITFTAADSGANLSTLIYAADRVDRLNVPDTLKAQMSACITAPMVLMSDRGGGLASVVGSSLDWHDALGGHSVDAHLEKFGPSSYQVDSNQWRISARKGLTTELYKHGLDERDLHATVNFFSKLALADEQNAGLSFVPGHCAAGDWIALRTEVDLLIVCSTAPHPSDPQWNPSAVRVTVTAAETYDDTDPSMTFRDESARALRAAKAVLV
jgi:uncharacterized protein YcgI (DUF1989 family)